VERRGAEGVKRKRVEMELRLLRGRKRMTGGRKRK